jgi:hypothetical protein
MEAVTYVVLAALAILAGLVIHGTIVKNRWGINLRRITCPNCGQEMPRIRTPASGSEALWGGTTCPNCQCQVDKWGRRIAG